MVIGPLDDRTYVFKEENYLNKFLILSIYFMIIIKTQDNGLWFVAFKMNGSPIDWSFLTWVFPNVIVNFCVFVVVLFLNLRRRNLQLERKFWCQTIGVSCPLTSYFHIGQQEAHQLIGVERRNAASLNLKRVSFEVACPLNVRKGLSK